MRLSLHHRAVVSGALLCVPLAVGLAVVAGGATPHPAATSRATPTINPGLIIYPRTVAVGVTLSPRWRLVGTLYPAYPGRNTLRLRLEGANPALEARSSIVLEVTMPGMAMTPLRVTLHDQGGWANGVFTLPMFGIYQAQVRVVSPLGHATGILDLPLSLPRG